MVDFVKLTRMNAMGKVVGPVFVNREMIVMLSPSNDVVPMTDITTESTSMLLVKETPEEIIQAPATLINENKS